MTREDAISIMNVIVHMLEEKYDTDRVEEAVDIAIEALSAEPCEDVIDRAEAMTEIMMFAGNVKSNEEDVYIKVSDVVQLLRELPSVTPKLQMVQNPCFECGCNYCTNDDCENRYIIDIAESEDKE